MRAHVCVCVCVWGGGGGLVGVGGWVGGCAATIHPSPPVEYYNCRGISNVLDTNPPLQVCCRV